MNKTKESPWQLKMKETISIMRADELEYLEMLIENRRAEITNYIKRNQLLEAIDKIESNQELTHILRHQYNIGTTFEMMRASVKANILKPDGVRLILKLNNLNQ